MMRTLTLIFVVTAFVAFAIGLGLGAVRVSGAAGFMLLSSVAAGLAIVCDMAWARG